MILHENIPYEEAIIEKAIEDIEIQLLTVKSKQAKNFWLERNMQPLRFCSDNNLQVQKLYTLIIYNL